MYAKHADIPRPIIFSYLHINSVLLATQSAKYWGEMEDAMDVLLEQLEANPSPSQGYTIITLRVCSF